MNKLIIFLQAGLFYLIPYLIGKALVTIGERRNLKTFNIPEKKSEPITKIGEFFVLGVLSLFLLAIFVEYALGPVLNIEFQKLYFPIVWLFAALSIAINLFKKRTDKKKGKTVGFRPLALIVLISLAVYSFWSYKSPYPLNWDYYQHQTLARLIQKGEFDYFTTNISDTFSFNSYPPTFHLLLAVSQYPAKLTVDYILDYWNIIGLYHLITVGLASYILAFAVSRKKEVALLSSIVGIITFDSITSFTNLFLLPQTLTAVVFVLLLSNVISGGQKDVKIPRFWLVLSGVVSLVLMHYLIGTFSSLILIVVYLLVRFRKKAKKALKYFPFVYLIPVAVIGAVLISDFVDLSLINQGEARLYLYDLSEKSGFTQTIYGNALLFFVPLGVFYAISKKKWEYNLALILLFGFGGILYSSFPYVIKFYVLARFVVHLFIALGIWALLKYIESPALKFLAYAMVTFTFGVLLLFNVIFWKNWISFRGEFTHISDYDIKAAEFLQRNYRDKETLLISDPATQLIFEGLGGIDSAGGGFMSFENRTYLHQALTASTPELALSHFEKINDRVLTEPKRKLIALSGRTFAWKDFDVENRYRFDSNVWTPEELSYWDELKVGEFGKDKKSYELVYNSPYVWIFEFK